MRDRLIELVKPFVSGSACEQESGLCEFIDCRTCNARALADNLLANGVIVPPCKVGTKIYFAEFESGGCLVGELMSFCLDAAHLWFNCKYNCGLNYWHPIEDFSKTVFLTKELAEEALKKYRSRGA